jgi:tRNA1Val (adenine37-N6)-methyltransferase
MQGVPVKDDETIDTILNGKLKIVQKRHGYRFSVDAILLPGFFIPREDDIGIDLGTGSGIIPIILATKTKVRKIFGVEIQAELADMARRSVKLSDLEDRIVVIHEDMKNLEGVFDPESVDWVTSNPPYYKVGSGRINPHLQKAIARHELKGSLEDVIKVSGYVLKPLGRIALIYSVERLVDVLHWLRVGKLEPKRLRLVHSNHTARPKFALVEAIKGARPELMIERPLYIYRPDGGYTEEMQDFYELV